MNCYCKKKILSLNEDFTDYNTFNFDNYKDLFNKDEFKHD